MREDALLQLAFDYAGYIRQSVSVVRDLPVAELLGYAAYKKLVIESISD